MKRAGKFSEVCLSRFVTFEIVLTSALTATKSIPASSIHSSIPWPVKSGQYSGQLHYSTVKEFYQKAFPAADNPELMFKLMQKESLKWHPDKIAELFRRHPVGEGERMVVNLIARVVIEMRAEAQAKRNG